MGRKSGWSHTKRSVSAHSLGREGEGDGHGGTGSERRQRPEVSNATAECRVAVGAAATRASAVQAGARSLLSAFASSCFLFLQNVASVFAAPAVAADPGRHGLEGQLVVAGVDVARRLDLTEGQSNSQSVSQTNTDAGEQQSAGRYVAAAASNSPPASVAAAASSRCAVPSGAPCLQTASRATRAGCSPVRSAITVCVRCC